MIGVCRADSGLGGYGAIILYGKVEREISDRIEHTTCNRMVLHAAIEVLSCISPEEGHLEMIAVNDYLNQCLSPKKREQVMHGGWQNVPNRDLLTELYKVAGPHRVACRRPDPQSEGQYMDKAGELARECFQEDNNLVMAPVYENRQSRSIPMVTFYPIRQRDAEDDFEFSEN